MKQLTSLAWKEWHESRAFLWIALGVFLGLPLVQALESVAQQTSHFFIETTPWVLYFGGVLALFVAVGITCRDFHGHLEDFWRSRPVSVMGWLIVKFFMGLAVVIVSCVAPLGVELLINYRNHPSSIQTIGPMLVFLPFLWMLIYCLGFLAGCLVRRPAHAAMMSLAAILLLYFLLMILPPSRWLGFTRIVSAFVEPNYYYQVDESFLQIWYYSYAAPALILGLMVLLLSLIAVRRGWRIDSNRKLMYGVVAGAFLALIASAGVQLGSNLPVQWQVDLPNHEQVVMLRCDGQNGFVITSLPSGTILFDAGIGQGFDPHPSLAFRRLRLTDSGIQLGSPKWIESSGLPSCQAWAPGHPEVEYSVSRSSELPTGYFELITYELDQTSAGDEPLPLWNYHFPDSDDEPYRDGVRLYAYQNRLYVIGTHLVILDISNPRAPRIISDVPFPDPFGSNQMNVGKFTEHLPQIPGLPPRQRLEAMLGMGAALQGDTYCVGSNGNIIEFHLVQLTDLKAVFDLVGQYNSTILQRAFGASQHGNLKLVNGYLYDGVGDSDEYDARFFGNYYASSGNDAFFNPRTDVFDTRGSDPLRVVGHFAAPGARIVCPLPDGRALVGGDKLWLIGVPPRTAGY
jgi:hypothetical protein